MYQNDCKVFKFLLETFYNNKCIRKFKAVCYMLHRFRSDFESFANIVHEKDYFDSWKYKVLTKTNIHLMWTKKKKIEHLCTCNFALLSNRRFIVLLSVWNFENQTHESQQSILFHLITSGGCLHDSPFTSFYFLYFLTILHFSNANNKW